MEFATGGDMFQLVVANKGLPEQDARWYFQQLIIAVDYCHKMVCRLSLSQSIPTWTERFQIPTSQENLPQKLRMKAAVIDCEVPRQFVLMVMHHKLEHVSIPHLASFILSDWKKCCRASQIETSS